MREADGTLADLTLALNEAIVELAAPVTQADGSLASATSQLNALLVWADSAVAPADGTLASATSQYNLFVGESMAGLYDRITTSDDNVQVHYLVAGLKGYGTGIWTRVQVLNGINALLASPLTAAEEADYDAIADQMDVQANATAKLGYGNQIEAAMIAAEAGLLTDTSWRTALGIS